MSVLSSSATFAAMASRSSRLVVGAIKQKRQSTTTVATSSTTSSTMTATINPLAKAFRWYSNKLETHPIVTKSLTAATIGMSGDILCQYYIDKPEAERKNSSNDVASDVFWWLDTARAGRFFLLGGALVGPWCHAWFGWLATTFPKLTLSSVATRVVLDQLAFTPVILSTFISSLWSLEHVMDTTDKKNNDTNKPAAPLDIPQRLRDTLPALWLTNIAVWTPVQLFNFGFVTQRYQVLFANVISLAWNAYISFSTRAKSSCSSDIVAAQVEDEHRLPASAVTAPVVLVQRVATKLTAA